MLLILSLNLSVEKTLSDKTKPPPRMPKDDAPYRRHITVLLFV
jgi:hypothetical protein